MEGWVKTHRKIIDWRYFKNSEIFHVWTTLLILANYKEGFTADGTKLNAGQLMTSNKSLSEKTGLSESKIFRIIEKLKIEGQIEKQGSNKNTVITIVNYEIYQEHEMQIEEQVKTKRRASEEQVKTNKNANNNKKEKNVKNIIIKPSPLAFLFPKDPKIQEWLSTGKPEVQERILNDHSHHVLVEEINKAYCWQLSKGSRKSDMFLVNWLSNKKTHGLGSNLAQESFEPRPLTFGMTPEEIQYAKENGLI
jgi:DNA-binding Lrp family transcriptional regulator